MNQVIDKCRTILQPDQIRIQEPLRAHTTFRIGGMADVMVLPETAKELEQVLVACNEEAVPYFVLGNGSNLLVGDGGIRGVVIKLGANFSQIQRIDNNRFTVQTGCLLSKVAAYAAKDSLTGMEFAAGIPGSVGGGVIMNAGAYGGEMSQILSKVRTLTKDGQWKDYEVDEMELGYRHSVFMEKSEIIVEAEFCLPTGQQETIYQTMAELAQKRKEKQPLEYPSAGSTFKRPEGYFAGKLIMDAGLAGFSVGGASVSRKHCGFVINEQQATAKDVMELVEQVKKIVWEKYQVQLELEVRTVGEFV